MPDDTDVRSALELSRPSPGVAEIALTRPAVLNRFDHALHEAITPTLQELAADRTVRSVVLSSTGKAFSGGGDFAMMAEAHDDPTKRALNRVSAQRAGEVLDLSLATRNGHSPPTTRSRGSPPSARSARPPTTDGDAVTVARGPSAGDRQPGTTCV